MNAILYVKMSRQTDNQQPDTQVAGAFDAVTDNEAVMAAVNRLLVVPSEEMPTIVTVTDLEKVKDQPFFMHAEVGDKVVLYTAAKKAVLYRPANDKIVELAPVNDAATN
jgi:hypothetical protein